MLGKLVYEGQGKAIGYRVLEDGRVEQTCMMQGKLLGEDFSATWTQVADPMRPDWTGFGKGWGIFWAKNGSSGRFDMIGNGTGKFDGLSSIRGSVCFSCMPGKFGHLNGIAVVFEMDSDKDGNFQNKGWEWK